MAELEETEAGFQESAKSSLEGRSKFQVPARTALGVARRSRPRDKSEAGCSSPGSCLIFGG